MSRAKNNNQNGKKLLKSLRLAGRGDVADVENLPRLSKSRIKQLCRQMKRLIRLY